jgi:hypothetical protein
MDEKHPDHLLESIKTIVIQNAKRTIHDIVRNLIYSKVFDLNRAAFDKDGDGIPDAHQPQDGEPGGALQEQWDNISTVAVRKLSETLLTLYGVQLIEKEFGLAHIDLADQKQQQILSRAAFKTAENQERMLEVEHKREVAKINQERERVENETKNMATIMEAEATAQVVEVETKAEVDKIRALADAEAERIRTIAAAERKAKELFNDGIDLRKLEIIKSAFAGTNLTIHDTSAGQMGRILNGLTDLMQQNVRTGQQSAVAAAAAAAAGPELMEDPFASEV